jgi:hypothetical protein
LAQATPHSITVSQHVRPSKFGHTSISFFIKRAGTNDSWESSDRVYTCEIGPSGTCERPGPHTFTVARGPRRYQDPVEHVRPDTDYLVRLQVSNVPSGDQWGPELKVHTPAA